MRTCFLFPGQGSQAPGMARDLFDASASVRALFEEAQDVTKMDLRRLCFEADEAELKQTDKTQPALTLANLAARAYLAELGITSDGAAGHSLGEFSALVDAGVISVADCFRLVQVRGRLMEEAGRRLQETAAAHGGDGYTAPGMAAVLGLSREDIQTALGTVPGRVFVANHNAPTQTVIAGEGPALDAAEAVLSEAGAGRYIRLKVSGPFHTPLLSDAGDAFAEVLASVDFHDPIKPFYANVTGARVAGAAEARDCVARQITSPVSWVDEEEAIKADGYEQILEVGPGTVLSGLWRAVCRDIRCRPAGKVDQIQSFVGE